jgi:Peptidyl-prolyl cis-trans isomerase (rotamase) - cyclophilin family
MRKIFSSIILVLSLLVAANFAQTTQTEKPAEQTNENSNSETLKKTNQRPAQDAAPKEPFEKASVETMRAQCIRFETEKGSIEIELFPESAPETVRNFLNLTALGAFDTTTFSRVVPGFVIQGGRISTRLQMTPELFSRAQRKIPDEPNQIKHTRGIVSMARTDEPNSASSHFFILVDDASFLDGKFAAFGRVTKGMETADAINKMPVENEKPLNPVRITKATIFPCAETSNQ